jgi:hypothetical protein
VYGFSRRQSIKGVDLVDYVWTHLKKNNFYINITEEEIFDFLETTFLTWTTIRV